MQIWLNNELNNLEDYFGSVAKGDPTRSSQHYKDFHWWQRGKEERKLKQKLDDNQEDDVILYRYITITEFWQMLTSKKFPLLNPSLWKDPLESPFFNARIRRESSEESIDTPFKKRFFAQCFTINDSSESMWKAYGQGEKLVRLKIKVRAIKKLIEHNALDFNSNHFYLGRVVYLNFEDIRNLFQNGYLFQKAYDMIYIDDQAKTLLVKRYAYAFEKEVRLIFDSHDHFPNKKNIPKVIDLNIPSLDSLISEILLDPDLEEHEVEFYKEAWNSIAPNQIKKCNLYSKSDYQLKLG